MRKLLCDVCNGNLEPHIKHVRDALTMEKFDIMSCTNCGLGHTMPRPENLNGYYSSDYYGGRHGMTDHFCARRRLRMTILMTGGDPEKKLLDVGCGDGTFLLHARRLGWEVMGTEMNPNGARHKGLEIRKTIGDFEDMAPFDCITLWHSFEHMENPGAVLASIRKLLAKNGILIIAVPDFGGLQARLFGGEWLHLDPPRHLYHFNVQSLTYCLKKYCFSIIRTWNREFEYDLMGWVQSSLNVLFSNPNAFFNLLTNKPCDLGSSQKAKHIFTGIALSPICLSAMAVEGITGNGGTLIAASRLRESE